MKFTDKTYFLEKTIKWEGKKLERSRFLPKLINKQPAIPYEKEGKEYLFYAGETNHLQKGVDELVMATPIHGGIAVVYKEQGKYNLFHEGKDFFDEPKDLVAFPHEFKDKGISVVYVQDRVTYAHLNGREVERDFYSLLDSYEYTCHILLSMRASALDEEKKKATEGKGFFGRKFTSFKHFFKGKKELKETSERIDEYLKEDPLSEINRIGPVVVYFNNEIPVSFEEYIEEKWKIPAKYFFHKNDLSLIQKDTYELDEALLMLEEEEGHLVAGYFVPLEEKFKKDLEKILF